MFPPLRSWFRQQAFRQELKRSLQDDGLVDQGEAKAIAERMQSYVETGRSAEARARKANRLIAVTERIAPGIENPQSFFASAAARSTFAQAVESVTHGRVTVSPTEGITAAPAKEVPRTTMRFAKVNQDGSNPKHIEYPLTLEGGRGLRQTSAVSPTLPNHPRVQVAPTFLPAPSYPGDASFWGELRDVIRWREMRMEGHDAAAAIPMPSVFEGKSMEEVAQAVRADYPTDFSEYLTKKLFAEGAEVDPILFPQASQTSFTNFVNVVACDGIAVGEVTDDCFAAKWMYGRPRPEEVVWAIHAGTLEAPADIVAKVKAMGLTHPTEFTAFYSEGGPASFPVYEGAPTHPAYPAMHSAISVTSFVKSILFNLTAEQLEEARAQDYAVSFGRTMAGVHYETDNIAGLMLGQEVMANYLVDHFTRTFGSESAEVAHLEKKIEAAKYDWRTHPRPEGFEAQWTLPVGDE